MKKEYYSVIIVLLIFTFLSFPVTNPLKSTIAYGYSDTPLLFFKFWYFKERLPLSMVDLYSKTEYFPFEQHYVASDYTTDIMKNLIYLIHGNEILNYNLYIWIGIFLSGFTMFYLCNIFVNNKLASLFSAIMFITFAFFTQEAKMGHPSSIDIFTVLLPFIMIEKMYREDSKKNFVLTILSFFLLPSSNPILMYHALIVLSLYILIRFGKSSIKPFFALILGLTLTINQLTIYLNYSSGGTFRSSNLIFLSLYRIFPGNTFSMFLWVVVPLISFYIYKKKKPGRIFNFFMLLFIIYILLSTQEPVYRLLEILPFSSALRASYRLIIFSGIGLSIMTAFALENLWSRYNERNKILFASFFILSILLLVDRTPVYNYIFYMTYNKPIIFNSISNKNYTILFYPTYTDWDNLTGPFDIYYEPFYYYFTIIHKNRAVFRYIAPQSNLDDLIALEEFFKEPSDQGLKEICHFGIDSIFCTECPENVIFFLDQKATPIFSNEDILIFNGSFREEEKAVYLRRTYFYEINCSE